MDTQKGAEPEKKGAEPEPSLQVMLGARPKDSSIYAPPEARERALNLKRNLEVSPQAENNRDKRARGAEDNLDQSMEDGEIRDEGENWKDVEGKKKHRNVDDANGKAANSQQQQRGRNHGEEIHGKGEEAARRSQQPEEGTAHVVYITGRDRNITLIRPQQVMKEITDQFSTVTKIEKAGRSLRIYCSTAQQKHQMLQTTRILIGDVAAECSEPRVKSARRQERTRKVRAVISGVPLDCTNEEIMEASGAISAVRMKRKTARGLTESLAVLLEYEGEDVPTEIQIEYLEFKVRPYVPAPMRCHHCQQYGHTRNHCRREEPVCPRCAGPHNYTQCHHTTEPKCANCGQQHNAAFQGCEKYIEVKDTLKIAATERISYRDALMKRRGRSEANYTTVEAGERNLQQQDSSSSGGKTGARRQQQHGGRETGAQIEQEGSRHGEVGAGVHHKHQQKQGGRNAGAQREQGGNSSDETAATEWSDRGAEGGQQQRGVSNTTTSKQEGIGGAEGGGQQQQRDEGITAAAATEQQRGESSKTSKEIEELIKEARTETSTKNKTEQARETQVEEIEKNQENSPSTSQTAFKKTVNNTKAPQFKHAATKPQAISAAGRRTTLATTANSNEQKNNQIQKGAGKKDEEDEQSTKQTKNTAGAQAETGTKNFSCESICKFLLQIIDRINASQFITKNTFEKDMFSAAMKHLELSKEEILAQRQKERKSEINQSK